MAVRGAEIVNIKLLNKLYKRRLEFRFRLRRSNKYELPRKKV